MTDTDDTPPPSRPLFIGPVKHSVSIEGHQTSISLEPLFWNALRQAAKEEGIAVNTLVARIDEERIEALTQGIRHTLPASHPPANLASAIRVWLWTRYCTDVPAARE